MSDICILRYGQTSEGSVDFLLIGAQWAHTTELNTDLSTGLRPCRALTVWVKSCARRTRARQLRAEIVWPDFLSQKLVSLPKFDCVWNHL